LTSTSVLIAEPEFASATSTSTSTSTPTPTSTSTHTHPQDRTTARVGSGHSHGHALGPGLLLAQSASSSASSFSIHLRRTIALGYSALDYYFDSFIPASPLLLPYFCISNPVSRTHLPVVSSSTSSYTSNRGANLIDVSPSLSRSAATRVSPPRRPALPCHSIELQEFPHQNHLNHSHTHPNPPHILVL